MTEPLESLRDGRYALLRELGQGSQGATLEALDKREGRLVAIKRFSVKGAASWKDVELAEREARVLSSLSHRSLPRYIDHFEERGCLYLVMERIEGDSLLELRKRGVRFDREQLLQFLQDASEALDYLHSRVPPVIHRDIKPGNVVQRPDGSFVLVDFGCVRDSLKPEGGSTVVGTFGYMAPEQFQGRALPASDVYAVGATAISLLTGREPEQLPHRGLSIDVAGALGKSVDPPLVRALAAMLEPDPDRRASSLTPLLASIGAGAARTRARERQRPRAARSERRRERPSAGDDLLSSPILVSLVLIALSIASVATFALFELLLPLLLTLLSIAFGSRLARGARAMRDVGRRGRAGLGRAQRAVRERSDGAAASRHAARVRTPPVERTRVRVDLDSDELEEPSIATGRARRAR